MAFVKDKGLAHTQKGGRKKQNVRKNPIFANLKERFEDVELPAELLDYFLRSNKSNIYQCVTIENDCFQIF